MISNTEDKKVIDDLLPKNYKVYEPLRKFKGADPSQKYAVVIMSEEAIKEIEFVLKQYYRNKLRVRENARQKRKETNTKQKHKSTSFHDYFASFNIIVDGLSPRSIGDLLKNNKYVTEKDMENLYRIAEDEENMERSDAKITPNLEDHGDSSKSENSDSSDSRNSSVEHVETKTSTKTKGSKKSA
jgi:hypothetical protein